MKLSRRHTIGTLIGGILGAPQAAKAVMNNPLNYPTPPSGYALGETTQKVDINQKEYIGHRIKQLQKVINGDFEEWQQDQLTNGNHEEELYYTEIDSLKSVSPVNKRILVNNARVKAQKKRWIKGAQKELESILKNCTFLDKLGIKL